MNSLFQDRCVRTLTFLILSTFLLLQGCSTQEFDDEAEARFQDHVDSTDINQTITLVPLLPDDENIEQGEFVSFQVTNHSNEYVTFDPDFGSRGMVYSENTREWVVVQNYVQFPNLRRALGPPGDDFPTATAVDYSTEVLPNQVNYIRVVVEGLRRPSIEEAGAPVIAYADIEIIR